MKNKKAQKSIYELQMAQLLKKSGYEFKTEFRFDKERRWRFDFVLKPVKTKIAIEVNGGSWIRGRHTFGTNYEKDLEKLNSAMLQGWIVLQYVPNTLPQVLDDLKKL